MREKIFTVVFYTFNIRRQTEKERVGLPSKPIKSKFCCLDVDLYIQGNVSLNYKRDLTSTIQMNFKFMIHLVLAIAPGGLSTFNVN